VSAGKKTMAVISSMDQPLGHNIGNSLEVIESIETLKGNGPSDLTELSLTIAGLMIYAAEKAAGYKEGYDMARKALDDGSGLEKFRAFISAQGGDPRIIEDISLIGTAAHAYDVCAGESGFVASVDGMQAGLASQHSGAGRVVKEDEIDHLAGIVLHRKTGDKVEKGDVLAQVYGNDEEKVRLAGEELIKAYTVKKEKTDPPELIQGMIGV
ncbi:MAG: pyrimidine-nucleoside phosphorylase, partial [Firmicutes bacterium]|nr:pyrimidine-nucleoside phosphorylase [Bacillota bacterium]